MEPAYALTIKFFLTALASFPSLVAFCTCKVQAEDLLVDFATPTKDFR